MMREVVLAPAKINLMLKVDGKRPDGYHELSMLMQRIALYDRITIEVSAGDSIETRCPGLMLPEGTENLTTRAARTVLSLAGKNFRVCIDLEKGIPDAAGLGGGSSDAASVMLTLNRMLNLGLAREEMIEAAVPLGADIPFFLFGANAWARGVGERLAAAPNVPLCWYLLVNPGVPLATASVFQNLGLTEGVHLTKLPLLDGSLASLRRVMVNDLEAVSERLCPEISRIKGRLADAGAAEVLMAGSGPTVFGLFEDEASARSGMQRLKREDAWKVLLAQGLP